MFIKKVLRRFRTIPRRISQQRQEWQQRRKARKFYAQFVHRRELCFDIGANIGKVTDIFLDLGARVVSVEPQPALAQILLSKYRNNPDVVVVPKGIAEQKGSYPLWLCSSANTIATFSDKWKTGRFQDREWESMVEVPATTLDDLIQAYGTPKFCKIDVEGFELQVIRGLLSPIPYLSFEFTAEFREDAVLCLRHLAAIGMDLFNYTEGESNALALSSWVNAERLIQELDKNSDPLFWGDIYARC